MNGKQHQILNCGPTCTRHSFNLLMTVNPQLVTGVIAYARFTDHVNHVKSSKEKTYMVLYIKDTALFWCDVVQNEKDCIEIASTLKVSIMHNCKI